ncbi:hypothetical protein P152DRAFT_470493 [Eremomyces bilateralis CBS 781.70]|uniref:Clu domain-containing protein n=1 Tax=Eremomyces bilateralis CBS 781.70 TaxID=1392243 RepID=A0A6G1GED7_9PEZI|nr:uncharacterized protein P152DRAFT_470493 [Eremomyces bilateralis CBS 781.70]KAF1816475.1 hypothetical protein P152DRAFT_470493 [Eremomyces bilateralis CBS 781.70]
MPPVSQQPVPADPPPTYSEMEESKDDAHSGVVHDTFALKIKLPHEPFETDITVAKQEQVQDLRQIISEQPYAVQYSCFHLEHDGKRINDFIDLSEVPGIDNGSIVELKEDPYTEKDARLHTLRVKELIGLASEKSDLTHGIQAGVSLLDSVMSAGMENSTAIPASDEQFKAHLNDTELTGYDFSSQGDVHAVLRPEQTPQPQTLKSLILSPWSPPPHYLRAQGHLLYLQLTINEGESLCITSHVSGFYVNKSTANRFDPCPRAAPKDYLSHSLLTLLLKVSPSFKSTFDTLQTSNADRDPISLYPLTHALPANPWLVPASAASTTTYQPDISRSQEAYMVGGADGSETLRDWNEEFQSTRELPRESVQDRVFRERLTAKLFADYNEAAVKGAVLVARGELAPLNPTEQKDAQIFVWNNIFYSFGADGVGTFATEGGDEAARVVVGKDVTGVRAVNQLDINGLFTAGTVVVDYLGKRIVGQSIVPGIFKQREPEENNIDYGGVEGKDVVARNEAFEPLFRQLSKQMFVKAHPVWDKKGKRHDLEASIETKGVLGTDGRKYVLDLYRITPLDMCWLERHWEENQLDEDSTPKPKAKGKNYPHRVAALRAELVESYIKHKVLPEKKPEVPAVKETNGAEAASAETKNDAKADQESTKSESDTLDEEKPAENEESAEKKEEAEGEAKAHASEEMISKHFLNPDVFSGQEPRTDAEKEEMAEDEARLREACKFLVDNVIPRLVSDYSTVDAGFPMDGLSLTALLHRRGINMRYLGHVTRLTGVAMKDGAPRLMVLYQLCRQEMVTRAFKHVAAKKMRNLPAVFGPACMAHLLNCLLGAEVNAQPVPEANAEVKKMFSDADFSFEATTPESLLTELEQEIEMRFKYNWSGPIIAKTPFSQLREIALTLGLQLEAKEYIFRREGMSKEVCEPSSASTGGKKKKKNQDNTAASCIVPAKVVQTFHAENVLNFVPVVKEASPRSALAEEAFAGGQMSLSTGQKQLGLELIYESLSLYEQIYGILHPECSRIYINLSSLLGNIGDKDAALELSRKAVIIAERTLGVDSVETLQAYLNYAIHEHSAGNGAKGVRLILHALELWKVIHGLDHPDAITAITNLAVMAGNQEHYPASIAWLHQALHFSSLYFTDQSISSAALTYQLAHNLALQGNTHAAVNKMRDARHVFENVCGKDDTRTKEAQHYLEFFTANAVKSARAVKMLQGAGLRSLPMLTARQRGVGVNSAAAGPGEAGPSTEGVAGSSLGNRTIDELVKYIEGDSKKTGKKGGRGRGNPKARGGKR